MGALSSEGRPFDASADGYVKGEGVGAFLIKPLSAAKADGDPIHGDKILVGQSRGRHLTAPNPLASLN